MTVLPSPIGLLGPEMDVVIKLCSDPNGPLTIPEFGRLRFQLLSCTVHLDRSVLPMDEGGHWNSLARLWGAQRLGFLFPRMEVQTFRTDGGLGGDGEKEFLKASIECFIDKVTREQVAFRRVKELKKSVGATLALGLFILLGMIWMIVNF